jgi:hypothetical protein
MFIGEEEWLEMVEDELGYCTGCQDFTRGKVGPEAVGYFCPVCGGWIVVGTDVLLMNEMVEVVRGC